MVGWPLAFLLDHLLKVSWSLAYLLGQLLTDGRPLIDRLFLLLRSILIHFSTDV